MVEHWYDYLPAAWFVADGPLVVAAGGRRLAGLVRRRQWEYDRFFSEDTPLLGDVEESDNG